LVQAGP